MAVIIRVFFSMVVTLENVFLKNRGDISAGPIVFLSLILLALGFFAKKKTNHVKDDLPQDNSNPDDWREMVAAAGYEYDEGQDIFYSRIDAWQRNMGYCRLYDEAAAPLNMIIDCEPIYFEYNQKRWLIEFWKGQYGMTTGCEVGVYNTKGPDIDIPGTFKGTFFGSVEDHELLNMSITLVKGDSRLLWRSDRHWWLTSFKLGEFSHPHDLIMYVNIVFIDTTMRDAFVQGLVNAGYPQEEFALKAGNQVSIVFSKPHTKQPLSRIKGTDWVVQVKNKYLCDKYLEVTAGYTTFPEKVKALHEKSPEVYKAMLVFGKPLLLFKSNEVIKDYLEKRETPS